MLHEPLSMKTVLLIDADGVARENVGKLLGAEGWRVRTESDGKKGLEAVVAQGPDLVIYDLLMPRLNGLQFTRTLRQAHAKKLKIILTSSRDFPSDRQGALDAGADAFLPKPISPLALKTAVDRIFGKETAAGPAVQTESALTASTWLKFWGVRGSTPTPGPETARYGGNTSCVEVRSEGEIIVLDAGTGLRLLGKSLEREFPDRGVQLTILLSHTHWDHIQGFPFFAPAYQPRNLVRIMGYIGARHGLRETLGGQMDSAYFPVSLQQMRGNIQVQELKDLNFQVGPVKIQAHYVNHPGICVGYRLFTPEGSIVFIPDVEPLQRLKSETAKAPAPDSLDYARSKDRKLVDFISESDVLIMDAQYTAQEYSEHVGWGHSCIDDTVRLAMEARVKQLFLFHHDPEHDDAKMDALLKQARAVIAAAKSPLRVAIAQEGVEVTLAAAKAPARPKQSLASKPADAKL